MFANVLSRERIDLLAMLSENNLLQGLYMAGGTAAALQLGHRIKETERLAKSVLPENH